MDVIEGQSLLESVHTRIRDAICDGSLKPNQRLNQDLLAEQLNVSRQPVNQALLLLKAQGFVIDAGRRGVMVAPISIKLVFDIYQIRGALDRLAAESAASHRWTKEEIEHGLDLLKTGEKALESESLKDLVVADISFHQFIYQMSGNALLADYLDTNFDHLRRVILLALIAGPEHQTYWRVHREIFTAIVQGNGPLAGLLAARHVAEASTMVCASVADGMNI